jgi:hypothetical protein
LQLIDPHIYTDEFRQHRLKQSGLDIVDHICKMMWQTVKKFHTPSTRQYIDLFTVRFCLAFPTLTLASKEFLETFVDVNMRGQVSSSYLMIAGYCMVHANPQKDGGPADGERTRLQKNIFEGMMGFCSSNSVHARCISQFYVIEMFKDPIFKAFIPAGCEITYNYL